MIGSRTARQATHLHWGEKLKLPHRNVRGDDRGETFSKGGTMLQPENESLLEVIQGLAQQIEEIDARIGDIANEATEPGALQYLILQREVDRLVRAKRALQDKWNHAMDVLAAYRSAHPDQLQFDRDHVLPPTR